MRAWTDFPPFTGVLAVCAHPDDESFGLGAIISTFARQGTRVDVLCFTHGEASTLHGVAGELGSVRTAELAAAGEILGVSRVELLDYPDGQLATISVGQLAAHVRRAADSVDALLVFDRGGITGHPDHERATEAAELAAATLACPVLAWSIPDDVATLLNDEFATSFVGRTSDELGMCIRVDRTRQVAAIGCHASQSVDNPVLWRRLELLGAAEHLRYLR